MKECWGTGRFVFQYAN